MSKHLITERRFLPYFCTQFLGAFNDNVYRNAFAILVTYFLAKENQAIILNIALMAFILPYFLFGAIAGQLADKFEKSALIRRIKIAEVLIMIIGCVTLYMQSVYAMLIVLFALGTQSAFFGPIKYSILPQHLARNEILDGNAYVESGTFIAILLGTIVGGFLASDIGYQNWLMLTMLGVALIGWFASREIPAAPPAMPELKVSFNIWRSSLQIIRKTRINQPVFQSILAASWFWFFGAIVLTQFPVFAAQVLRGDPQVAILLLATFCIGIGLGSFACSLLSGGKVEIGLMPFGAIGISYFTWQLGNTQIVSEGELLNLAALLALPGAWEMIFNLTMIAFSGGLFIVPVYAFMQVRSAAKHRSRTIAVNNIFNSLFMTLAGAMAAVMLYFEFSVLEIFKVTAILNMLVTLYILSVVPEFFLRLVSWLLVHSVYRIKKEDLHHVPVEGPALLVCNHVSFIDPALLLAVLPRPARFVMYHKFYELPIAKKLFQWLNSIPIGTKREDPELVESAFDTIAEALENGELVVIFPEGGITRDGEVAKFQPGIDQILKRTPVPVVPLALRGMWGTWFSRHQGRAMRGLPKAILKKISIVSGPPVAPQAADRITMHQQVVNLRGNEK
ncbi:MAG: MFS transporter [Gammaproteobacteria bacterium]|nr:MFS transporter [Gammaproteobacteria bacterium]